jgi:hypothetical protein
MATDKKWKTYVCVCHNTGETRSFTGFSKEKVLSEVRSDEGCCLSLVREGEFKGRITVVELKPNKKKDIVFV